MAGCLARPTRTASKPWYAHIPGLTVIMPATPADAKGLLKSAIRSDDPVIFIEARGPATATRPRSPTAKDFLVPIGKADIKPGRLGRDPDHLLPLAQDQLMAAAEQLAGEGIDAEVIDLRTIRPLDMETILKPRWSRPTGP